MKPTQAAPATPSAQRASPWHAFRHYAGAHLKLAAGVALGLAALLLLAGWFFPELWRPAFAAWRPFAFALFGAGALLMWQQTRRDEARVRQEALSSLTHSSFIPYEFAPVTLPMEEPAEPEAGRASNAEDAFAADAAALTSTTSTPTETSAAAPPPLGPPQWSPGLLRALEWRRFEALCEEIFKQDGYVTKRSEPGSADGGDSLWLHSRLDLVQPVRIVQCCNWSGEPVGVAAVREFLGAMVDAGLKSGALMSCGAFTAEAEALARRHGIMAVSGPDLLALVNKRPEALQRELLAVATQGDYRRPTCPRCGTKMLAPPDAGSDGGPTRWTCAEAPRCSGNLQWSAGPA